MSLDPQPLPSCASEADLRSLSCFSFGPRGHRLFPTSMTVFLACLVHDGCSGILSPQGQDLDFLRNMGLRLRLRILFTFAFQTIALFRIWLGIRNRELKRTFWLGNPNRELQLTFWLLESCQSGSSSGQRSLYVQPAFRTQCLTKRLLGGPEKDLAMSHA